MSITVLMLIEIIVDMFNITNETNDDFSNINDESNSSIISNEYLNDNEANEDNLYGGVQKVTPKIIFHPQK